MVSGTPKKFQNYFLIIGIVLVLLAAVLAKRIHEDVGFRNAAAPSDSGFAYMEPYQESRPLPPIKIMGPEGRVLDLSGFRGRYVLLNLWATWCGPCITELPSLQRLGDRYKEHGLKVLAVSLDRGKTIEDLTNFLKMHDLGPAGPDHVALYHDFQDDIQNAITFNGLPVTFLVGPEGHILYQAKKPAEWDGEDIVNFLKSVQKAKAY